jgi:hypothetical protein
MDNWLLLPSGLVLGRSRLFHRCWYLESLIDGGILMTLVGPMDASLVRSIEVMLDASKADASKFAVGTLFTQTSFTGNNHVPFFLSDRHLV